jgi:uncharacterized membrane protein
VAGVELAPVPKTSRNEHYRREVSRVEGFSDAVFAFAITLLVVSLEVPKTFSELLQVMRGFPAFAVSFALLFQIWWRHYLFFRNYDLEDAHTISLTGVLLFVVLFFVYPLKFLWSLVFAPLQGRAITGDVIAVGQMPILFGVYGAGVVATFGILAAMYSHAYRCRGDLDLTPVEIVNTRIEIYRNAALSGIGLLSILVAVVMRRIAPQLIGIAGLVYFAIGLSEWGLGEYRGRLIRRLPRTDTALTAPASGSSH